MALNIINFQGAFAFGSITAAIQLLLEGSVQIESLPDSFERIMVRC